MKQNNILRFKQQITEYDKKKATVKYIDFKFNAINKNDFKDILEEAEKDNIDINIVGYVNTGDKELLDEENEKDREKIYGKLIVFNQNPKDDEDTEAEINVYEKLHGATVGYIKVGDTEYIEVRDKSFLFIFWWFIGLLILLISLLLTKCGADNIVDESENNIETQESISIADGDEFDGDIDNGYKVPEVSTEQIKVVGKSVIYVREGDTVDLVNHEDNTVLFRYTVYMGEEVIFEMEDWIQPGQKIAWEAYKYFDKAGEYSISYHIDTKDITTHKDCNPVNINGITVIVE